MLNKVIIVLGMHRSGTSAVAGALRCMGVDLGRKLMADSADNSKGYFEHAEIVDIHERLLSVLASSWDDSRPLPLDWWEKKEIQPFKEALHHVIKRDFQGADLWAVKDPRMCRLLPLWHDVLATLNISSRALIMVRHPQEVALSLQSRDRMDISMAYLLWLNHLLDSEVGSRGMPRVIVSYARLLRECGQQMACVADKLDVVWPNAEEKAKQALDGFISPALRHHQDEQKDDVPDLVQQVYDVFLHAAQTGRLTQANEKRLDTLRANLTAGLAVLRPVLDEVGQLSVSHRHAVEEVTRLSDIERHLRTVIDEQLAAHVKDLTEHQLKDQHISNLEVSIGAKDQHISNLEASVGAKDQHISNLEASIGAKDQHISNLEASVGAKDQHIVHLEALLAQQLEAMASFEQKVDGLVHEMVELMLSRRMGALVWIGEQKREHIKRVLDFVKGAHGRED